MHLTPRHRAILDLDLAVWDQNMATNLRGMLLCCRQAICPRRWRDRQHVVVPGAQR